MWVIRASGASAMQVTRHAAFASREDIVDMGSFKAHESMVAPMCVSVSSVIRVMSENCVRDIGASAGGWLPRAAPDALLICWDTLYSVVQVKRVTPSSLLGRNARTPDEDR